MEVLFDVFDISAPQIPIIERRTSNRKKKKVELFVLILKGKDIRLFPKEIYLTERCCGGKPVSPAVLKCDILVCIYT